MFGTRITLFHLLGFRIQVDLSWLVIAVLITWSLAKGYFPQLAGGLDDGTYWRMGVAGALGLFLSVILHELAHSVVARAYGIEIKSITLFIFGGVAEMAGEPPSARAEFRMAIAGPIMSGALALLFHALAGLAAGAGAPLPVSGVLAYLSMINAVLAVFNLVPAFPLDGGRALRAWMWGRGGNLHAATQTASRIGGLFGLAMIVLGVINVVGGNFVGGMWWFLIGLFLRNAAGTSFTQLIAKETFAGAPVGRFMTRDIATVPPELPLSVFVDDYVYRLHHEFFPVASGERLFGGVPVALLKSVPRADWGRVRVGDLMVPPSNENTVSPLMDAAEALALMSRTGQSRLMVAEGTHLVGLLTLKDMLAYLTLKIELEGDT